MDVSSSNAVTVGASAAATSAARASSESGDESGNGAGSELERMRQLIADARAMTTEVLAETQAVHDRASARPRVPPPATAAPAGNNTATTAAVPAMRVVGEGAGAGNASGGTAGTSASASSSGGATGGEEPEISEVEALTQVLESALSRMEGMVHGRTAQPGGPVATESGEGPSSSAPGETAEPAAAAREDDGGARTMRTNEEADAVMADVLREDMDILHRMEVILNEVQRHDETGASAGAREGAGESASLMDARAADVSAMATRDAARRLQTVTRRLGRDGARDNSLVW